jgi:tetratricopeptide (TPR) repeat protein
MELNPGYFWTPFFNGISLAAQGRHDDAEREMKRAIELDPLSHVLGPGLGFIYQTARRFDEAIAECRKTLDLEPDSLLALWIIGISYCHKSMYEESVAALQKAAQLTRETYYAGHLAYCYARFGKTAEALDLVRQLQSRSETEYVAPVFFAWIYGALGETDRAFEYLERAFGERHPLVAPLNEWQIFDSLRPDPRFAGYVSRIRP